MIDFHPCRSCKDCSKGLWSLVRGLLTILRNKNLLGLTSRLTAAPCESGSVRERPQQSKKATKYFCLCKISLATFAFSAIAFAARGEAQQLPTLSYETPVFNQVTGPSISPVPSVQFPGTTCNTPNSMCAIQNNGMGAHQVIFCIVSGTVSSLDIWIEGSNDQTLTATVPTPAQWIQISPEAIFPTGTTGCGTLETGQYYQFVRLHLATLSGTSPKLSAWYSGIGTALPSASVLQNRGSQFTATNPGVPLVFSVKSSPQNVSPFTLAIFGASVANPNSVPVFASLTCVGASGALEWEIPANDTRPLDIGGPGLTCAGTSTIACSTSAGSAVDPTNSCLVNLVTKTFLTVRTQINFAGTVGATSLQPPE